MQCCVDGFAALWKMIFCWTHMTNVNVPSASCHQNSQCLCFAFYHFTHNKVNKPKLMLPFPWTTEYFVLFFKQKKTNTNSKRNKKKTIHFLLNSSMWISKVFERRTAQIEKEEKERMEEIKKELPNGTICLSSFRETNKTSTAFYMKNRQTIQI